MLNRVLLKIRHNYFISDKPPNVLYIACHFRNSGASDSVTAMFSSTPGYLPLTSKHMSYRCTAALAPISGDHS